ncbi:MAG TPA: hypothetical protein VK722_05970 [Candidatus Aquilonibacter sp.]|jgi:hypothetical protein|nr:hypothetical protein [Candidatus Aquilonibacter sp.]
MVSKKCHRCAAHILCLLIFLFTASFLLAQADFSADIVDLQKPGAPSSARVYFTKDKMRAEPQSASARGAGAFIVNFTTQTSMVLMAQQHMYMEMPAQSQNQRLGYSFFEVGDVENACGAWQNNARNQGSACHKVGDESVNGRTAVKYETTGANGDTSYFWLDPKLRFPVKWQGKNNSGELRNIQEGAQPASLFEVPAGFTKMQMPMGMPQPR